jgi:hypothetical protein
VLGFSPGQSRTSSGVRIAGRAVSSVLVAHHPATREVSPAPNPFADLHGRVAFGLHLTSDYAELLEKSFGAQLYAGAAVGDAVTKLPASTVAAVGVGGLDKGVRSLSHQLTRFAPDLGSVVTRALGVSLDDIATTLGSRTVATLGNVPNSDVAPKVVVRAHPDDLAVAHRTIRTLIAKSNAHGGPGLTMRDVGDDVVVATDPAYASSVIAGGDLGSQPGFEQAVGPVTGTVVAMGYVDLARLLDGQVSDSGAAHSLSAVGFAVTRSGTATTLRVRVVAR